MDWRGQGWTSDMERVSVLRSSAMRQWSYNEKLIAGGLVN